MDLLVRLASDRTGESRDFPDIRPDLLFPSKHGTATVVDVVGPCWDQAPLKTMVRSYHAQRCL